MSSFCWLLQKHSLCRSLPNICLQIQGIVASDMKSKVSASTILSPETVLRLHAGIAVGSISIWPAFLLPAPAKAVARLAGEVFLMANLADFQAGGSKISSALLPIVFATGADVCPAGYILVLDSATAASSATVSAPGGCVICPPGTYSLNSLADGSVNPSRPGCLNCLPNATCPGGFRVLLGMGTWVADVEMGIYLLKSCPAGHELVNTIGGVFSHDVQAR